MQWDNKLYNNSCYIKYFIITTSWDESNKLIEYITWMKEINIFMKASTRYTFEIFVTLTWILIYYTCIVHFTCEIWHIRQRINLNFTIGIESDPCNLNLINYYYI